MNVDRIKSSSPVSTTSSNSSGTMSEYERDKDESTIALWVEIFSANPDLAEIRRLINLGANPLAVAGEQLDAEDFTERGDLMPHVIVKKNHVSVMQLYLDQDISVSGKDAKNRTPLQLAAEKGHIQMMRLLLGPVS